MRTWLRVVPIVLLVVLVQGCQGRGVAPETERAFQEGRSFRGALVARSQRAPATAADTASLIALGYLERARLGLGSPYRLVDFALNDPRLPDATRLSTGWALFAMIYDGETHQVEALALDSLFLVADANRRSTPRRLLRELERTVGEAQDPRAGELAVRLAFSLGSGERLLRSPASTVAPRAAALLRDRALARADLLRLLDEAQEAGTNPVHLVPSWRLARRFAVEQPMLDQPSAAQEIEATERAEELLHRMRALAQRARRTADDSTAPLPAVTRSASLLSETAARTLAALPHVRQMPPQAPVAVAVSASRERIMAESGVTGETRRARLAYLEGAVNEEMLVAHHAQLGDGHGRRVAGATLWAASAMRSYAQETPWFPNTGGPSVADLKARYGIASVSFDEEVPVEWRPYFRRLLASSLSDLERVLPTLAFRGIGIHFGQQPLESALAVHDPRTRTVFIPLATGPGTLAHELAHDLDWQVASRHFGRRGEYSTDQAVREHRSTLASSLRGLTTAALVPPGPENQYKPPHTQRPTEVFATSVDWFVAAALARDGRVNGYLTAVQDDALTGFAAVRPPDVHGESGEATIAVLGEMVELPRATQSWFLERFGRERELNAFDQARRVLEVTSTTGATRALLADPRVGLTPLSASLCAETPPDDDPLAVARRRAVDLAAESVARRLLSQRGLPLPDGGTARLDPLLTPPRLIDPALIAPELQRLQRAVLDRVQTLEQQRSWLPMGESYVGSC